MLAKFTKRLFLLPFVLLQACFSRFSGEVDKCISDSYYYAKGSGEIIYSPMGNWFSLGYDKMEADPASFRPIARDFGKDKDFVFYKGNKLPQADHATFVVEDDVIKDAKHVYVSADYSSVKIVEDADPRSYRYLRDDMGYSSKWAKDDFNYFLYNRKVEVDYPSFRILKNELVADKDFIYETTTIANDTAIWGEPFLKKRDSVKGEIKDINTVYASMGNTVYAMHAQIGYQKHDFDEIRNMKIVEESTIIVDETLLVKGLNFPYEGVDIATFEKLGEEAPYAYYRDKNHVYYEGELIPDGDRDSFRLLDWGYAKDKKTVYFHGEVVEGADPHKFRYDEKRLEWVDGKTVYRFGKAIEK